MSGPFHIAVDVGATHIRAGLFAENNPTLLSHARNGTPHSSQADDILEAILQTIRQVMPSDKHTLIGVAVGAPGPLDPYEGVVISAPNIPSWRNVPLRQWLAQRLDCPVQIGNDANLAALGEWRFGAGQGVSDLVYLTISTGIGGGVIADGHLLLGRRGLAAELGHVTILPGGPRCNCGQRGHLEALASGPAIAREARRSLSDSPRPSLLRDLSHGDPSRITAQMTSEAALAGDPLAREVIATAGHFIGQALASLLCVFNPSLIILGGGVSQAGSVLLDPVQESITQLAISPSYLEGLRILPASLGDDVGLFGAYALSLGLTSEPQRKSSPMIPS
ncbi:MAG: ROK family protein [Anaerolineales bacterium]|jgi:glucokinase